MSGNGSFSLIETVVASSATSACVTAPSRPPNPSFLNHFSSEAMTSALVTGAVTPSGRMLARTMAAYADPNVSGSVIELGPGTGPVTQALIQRGVAPERLVLVEYDPEFCKLLMIILPGPTELAFIIV